MSDIWENAYGCDSLTPGEDSDRDGRLNSEEAIAGTNPLDPGDSFTVRQLIPQKDQILVSWNSRKDAVYELQFRSSSTGAEWERVGELIEGIGGPQWESISAAETNGGSLRIAQVQSGVATLAATSSAAGHDSDYDGQTDMEEYFAGSNPFDFYSRFEIDTIMRGTACRVEWSSQAGKVYQVETRSDLSESNWEAIEGSITGNGGVIGLTFPTPDSSNLFFRVSVSDQDTDGDGLTDWEEHRLGLDPELAISNLTGPNDLEFFENAVTEPIAVSIRSEIPVATPSEGTPGKLIVSRTGSPAPVTIQYQVNGDAVPGSDYAALSGSLHFPFGQDEAEITISPIAGSLGTMDRSAIVTLTHSGDYELGDSSSASVTLFSRRAISVTDYGATGDGVTDDTEALQDALHALEASDVHNTLYFPAGTYRVNSFISGSETASTPYFILRLGNIDLSGRDLLIEGAPDSRIYSTVSPIRAHILETRATFRSLRFRGMTFEKDSVVLGVPQTVEPNGADGVSLIQVDERPVASFEFDDCQFINCHGAIKTYGSGYDIRGKLGVFRMTGSTVSNPWGANSVANSKIWGGGQLVFLSPWINRAYYRDNHFDGGSEWESSPELNPLGREKDGSHFGSPLNLDFTDNLVEGMRVEAVYQLHDSLMSYTSSSVTLPAIGETATVFVRDLPSTFETGQLIAIRGPIDSVAKSLSFTVADYNPTTRELTILNEGLNDQEVGGTLFPSSLPIYLQGDHPGQARIERNIVLGGAAGIAADVSSIIRNNYTESCGAGILIYGNARTPLYPGGTGTLIENNVIVLPDTSNERSYNTYGIHSWGPEEIIRQNLIMAPISSHLTGIALRGNDAHVENNTVLAMQVTRNGYGSTNRSVGIGVGNSSLKAWIESNTTYGFDVGVGPVDRSQSIPHYVIDHTSYNDELPIDPRGLLQVE